VTVFSSQEKPHGTVDNAVGDGSVRSAATFAEATFSLDLGPSFADARRGDHRRP
jgi:hypothetical protein